MTDAEATQWRDRLAGRFGDDITQEAILIALEHQASHLLAYALRMGQVLRRWGYHDGLRRDGRRSLAGRVPVWAVVSTRADDPAVLTDMRRQIRALPAFVRVWHAAYGTRVVHRCPHPMSAWYGYAGAGTRKIRCRDCHADHVRQGRARHGQ